MKNLIYLFLAVMLISCGGSNLATDGHPEDDYKNTKNPRGYVRPQPNDGSNNSGDNTGDNTGDGMLTGTNCAPPDLRKNVPLNRKICKTDDCLIQFAGYWWWTNYQYSDTVHWFWNNGSSWNPRGAWVDGEGLHLTVKKDDLGGGTAWFSSEVVAVFENDKKTLAKTGYGTYLVSARIKSDASFDKLDKNVAFGLFTFDKTGTYNSNNPYREIDLAEISRWGVPPASNVLDPRLAVGNAQFAIQLWNSYPQNVKRYTINPVKEITLVMKWTGEGQPVTFYQYDGIYTLDNLPGSSAQTWTTAKEQNKFIPNDGCQLFHMNLWMGNFGEGNAHPGPSNGQTSEVVVTNFQYRK